MPGRGNEGNFRYQLIHLYNSQKPAITSRLGKNFAKGELLLSEEIQHITNNTHVAFHVKRTSDIITCELFI